MTEQERLLKSYDEWERERIELLQNVNAAQLSGELDAEKAEELRKNLIKWPPIFEHTF